MGGLRSWVVAVTDRRRGTTTVPGFDPARRTAIAARQRGCATENRVHQAVGVAALQRSLALGCCVWATALYPAGAVGAGIFPDAAVAGAGELSHVSADGPPDAAATLRVYAAVEAFVRGTTPAVEAKDLPPVYGCAVVLRLAGEVIGRGSSIGGPGQTPSAARIGDAAAAAWSEAERRLTTALAAAASERENAEEGRPGGAEPAMTPQRRDDIRAAKVMSMRQDLQISLELSGPLMRINANAYGDFDATLQPGMDGVLAAMDGKVGATFPGAETSGNVMPGDAARRAVGAVGMSVRGDAGGGSMVSLTEPAELEKKQGVTLYRFRTTHVAQWRSDKPPELLYRGQKLVMQQDVDDVTELWYIADRLAGNLANRADGAFDQTVTLGTGVTETPAQPAFSIAVAKLALDRYVARRGDAPIAVAIRKRVPRWEAALDASARGTPSPAVDAGVLLGNGSFTDNTAVKRLQEFCAKADPTVEQSIVAYALVTAGPAAGLWPEATADGRRITRQVLSQNAPGALGTHMPWIGWAELELSRRDNLKSVPSASVLREMRSLIWKHQLQEVDAGPDAQDMVGGIVLPGGKNPLPTWQTARLVAFLGTMLGEPELTTSQERGPEIVKLLGAARYLRQLQVDDSLGWMCKDPLLVKGGLRNATWDERTQTDATAMGLLAVLEIIGGIEKASAAGK